MNNQIDKLMVKAGAYFGGKGVDYSNFDPKKFAELIVEECRYVMDCNKGSDQHTEWNRALFETSEKIKEHFGVEE